MLGSRLPGQAGIDPVLIHLNGEVACFSNFPELRFKTLAITKRRPGASEYNENCDEENENSLHAVQRNVDRRIFWESSFSDGISWKAGLQLSHRKPRTALDITSFGVNTVFLYMVLVL